MSIGLTKLMMMKEYRRRGGGCNEGMQKEKGNAMKA
jgi:hypothetical protein